MPREDYAALQPYLETVKLEMRQTLIEPNQPIEHVYFMESGYSSIVSNGGDAKVEIGIVGREGLVGVPVVLAADRSPFEYFIQSPGSGYRMPAQHLDQAVEDRSSLRRFLLRFAQALNVQTSRTAYVNAEYPLETRLARWLLMCHDRIDGDDLQITHDFLSLMLGTQRSSTTLGVQALEGHRMIRARRGKITILDRKTMEQVADDGYGLPEAEYARLIEGA